ncbi:GNAT family N-acetyltransferase [Chromobacterium alticapitis]|uniref:RimJ/RimL family protein N-acetyltransferase n=1 Tax=Chromobacterium alticapitis TaxID=2073169 RepID=A0A2S5DL46_9NEIS|nr:GNAT family protein [Chromobacterium alticapitis]POZ63721.1 RimJ/RimL family protein N-acetyltransferase [Chromobacterium alticapitis]
MTAAILQPISLLPPSVVHAERLFALIEASRASLRAWLPWVDATRSVEDSRAFLTGVTDGARDGAGCACWLIELNGELAGCIDIHGISKLNGSGLLGYWLADRFVGRGIMSGVVAQVLDVGFDDLGLNRIVIVAGVENARSRAVAERLGFAREGVQRDGLRLHGRFHDACQYSMLAREWRMRK